MRFVAAVSEQPSAPVVAADLTLISALLARVGRSRSRDTSWRDRHFDSLRDMREEGVQIAALFKVQSWLAEQALEKRIKKCRSPRILETA